MTARPCQFTFEVLPPAPHDGRYWKGSAHRAALVLVEEADGKELVRVVGFSRRAGGSLTELEPAQLFELWTFLAKHLAQQELLKDLLITGILSKPT